MLFRVLFFVDKRFASSYSIANLFGRVWALGANMKKYKGHVLFSPLRMDRSNLKSIGDETDEPI